MTKVLVTVGTTRFPSLVRFFDRPAPGCEIVIQHAEPGLALRHARGFAFSGKVQEWYAWADVVVTHAGAATVYELLETRRRVVVVPNLERVDKHQRDLAAHVAAHRYAMVVERLERFGGVEPLVAAALGFDPAPYVKTEFFKTQFLLDLLSGPDHATGPASRAAPVASSDGASSRASWLRRWRPALTGAARAREAGSSARVGALAAPGVARGTDPHPR